MERSVFLVLIIILSTFRIFTSEDIIDLSNSDDTQISVVEGDELPLRDYKVTGRGKIVIPNGFYINELGDFNSQDIERNKLLLKVDDFCKNLKNHIISDIIDPDFLFVFEKVFDNDLLDSSIEIVKWNLGYPFIQDDTAEVEVEIYLKDKLFKGIIYLENDSDWLISDMQVEVEEKISFDPSSPYYN